AVPVAAAVAVATVVAPVATAGLLSTAEVDLLEGTFDAEDPTIADVALLDELDALLGQPLRAARQQRNQFQVAQGVYELSTAADRARAARAAATARPDDYREYAHVVVDESQDVSPMQWRMLGRRGRLASWTIVGDPAQTAWTGDPSELERSRDRALGSRARHAYTLTTNYRNSAEIFEVAAAEIRTIAPDLPLPTAVRSTGVPPVALSVPLPAVAATVRSTVDEMLGQVEGTVGVITPVDRVGEVGEWLAAVGDARLQVVTSLQAKGMEYDGVVLVAPGEIRAGGAAGVRTLYVALSRATQRLVTVDVSP
ncbi:ATP-binding domain-containing protein, partial [Asanoa sp. NPDC050611]|uniref:ATP-binding domain-containing protein n=1 Tax=Asanoa sp. NPDC050611 TaxID=3157098 RepID=UPI0033F8A28A